MTDQELLGRYANDAPDKPALWRWRGWVTWQDDDETFTLHATIENQTPFFSLWKSGGHHLKEEFLGYITDHEAACLVREHLCVELNKVGWQGHEDSTEKYNAALVAAAEVRMKEENCAAAMRNVWRFF